VPHRNELIGEETFVRPQHEYKHVLKPSVDYLEHCGKLFLNRRDMGAFLGVSAATIQQSLSNGRIPLPMRLGLGKSYRWSVLELLEWVAADCPKRTQWTKERGWSGWTRWGRYGFT
jgi:predicted DNA-binding transcriptional regulator AlpA